MFYVNKLVFCLVDAFLKILKSLISIMSLFFANKFGKQSDYHSQSVVFAKFKVFFFMFMDKNINNRS